MDQRTQQPQPSQGVTFAQLAGLGQDEQRPEDAAQQLPIGEQEIKKARDTLQKYKDGKSNLEKRIVNNEQWWKRRHWEQMRSEKNTSASSTKEPEPTSAWLFNCLANKHADAMDNAPEPTILPREAGDQQEAKMLSSIMPVVLEQNGFEQTYDDVWWYKLKHGCGVYSVTWSPRKHNGLGDIDIRRVDLLNLFWEPGCTDIQKSPNLFYVTMQRNAALERAYPQLRGKLSGGTVNVAKYVYDDAVDTSECSAVVDWYYKTDDAQGRTVLHCAKFVNDVLLMATENEPERYPNGLYDHGEYPFVFDVLFPEEGTPAGFGYIDICKDPQAYIDLLGQAILENALIAATPRWLVRDDADFDEEAFADRKKTFIRAGQSLASDSIQQVTVSPLSGTYVDYLNFKITELKETSGNRDVSNGGTTSGATAASAIAAMQEAGSKLSRDMLKSAYRAYSKIVRTCIELIRQFYTVPRAFRIIGEAGAMEFAPYDNRNLRAQTVGGIYGGGDTYRLPEFDIEVSAQKASPYTKMSQNEMALNFYQLGFFSPQNTDQTLACLNMMDFDHKDDVTRTVQQNGTMAESLKQIGALLVQMTSEYRPELLPQIQQILAQSGVTQDIAQQAQAAGGAPVDAQSIGRLGGEEEKQESSVTKNARTRVAESTQPR